MEVAQLGYPSNPPELVDLLDVIHAAEYPAGLAESQALTYGNRKRMIPSIPPTWASEERQQMTTKLENEVTREMTLTVDGREVEITLLPMDIATASPEALQFHLKGMRTGDKTVPVHLILRALGWAPKFGQAIRPAMPRKESDEMNALLDELEKHFGKAA